MGAYVTSKFLNFYIMKFLNVQRFLDIYMGVLYISTGYREVLKIPATSTFFSSFYSKEVSSGKYPSLPGNCCLSGTGIK